MYNSNFSYNSVVYNSEDYSIAKIQIIPSSITLKPSVLQQFEAKVYDINGNEILVPLYWQIITGQGTIDQTGLYTASTSIGTTIVQVSTIYKNKVYSAVANILVTEEQVVLESVKVIPDSITLLPNSIFQFIAKGYDQFGNEIYPLTFTWSVENSEAGKINSQGLFTSSNNEGNYFSVVKATTTYDLITKSGYAFVKISSEYPILTYVRIIPQYIKLSINDYFIFQSYGYDQFNNLIPDTIFRWSSTIGSIDSSSALFYTDVSFGTYYNAIQVDAYYAGKLLSSFATVEIVAPFLQIISPYGNEIWQSGSVYSISWIYSGKYAHVFKLYYSINDNTPYIFIDEVSSDVTNYFWTIPKIYTTTARIKIEAFSKSDVLLASNVSNVFTIVMKITGSIVINYAAETTDSLVVTLSLTVDGYAPFKMKVSNYEDLHDAQWIDFVSEMMWVLLPGTGVKTVYVQFQDASGNQSIVYSDSIIYTVFEIIQKPMDYGIIIERRNMPAFIKYPAIDNFPIQQGTFEVWVSNFWDADDGLIHYVFDHCIPNQRYKNRICLYKNSQGYLVFEIIDKNSKIHRASTLVKLFPHKEIHNLSLNQTSVKLDAIPSFAQLDFNKDAVHDLFEIYSAYFFIYKLNSDPLVTLNVHGYDPVTNIITFQSVSDPGTYEFNFVANWSKLDTVQHLITVTWKLRPKYVFVPDPFVGPDIILDPNDTGPFFMRLYIDGVLRAEKVFTNSIKGAEGYVPIVYQPVIVDESPEYFYVGSDFKGNNQWDGILRELRILDIASTTSDVVEDYYIGRAGYPFMIDENKEQSRQNMWDNTLMLCHYKDHVYSVPSAGKLTVKSAL